MNALKTVGPALICALLAVGLAWLASAPSIAITPDSVQYISAAQSLAEGTGVASRVTEIGDERGQTPLSAWPPFYPMVLAVGSEQLDSGQRVVRMEWVRTANLLALALTFLPLAWLARMTVGGGAWVLCLLWYASARPTQLLASFAWSETVFVLLSLTALACTVRALVQDETEGRRTFWFLVGGIAAALATLTRYLGFSLLLALAITVLLRSEGLAPRRTLRRIALVVAPAGLLLSIWLTRNVIVTGDFFGSMPNVRDHAASRALVEALLTLGRDWIMPAVVPGSLVIPVAVVTGLFAGWLLWNAAVRFGPETFEFHPLQLTAATALTQYLWIYLAMLLASSSTVALDPVNTRLLAPIYPCILLLLAAMLRGALDQIPDRTATLALGALTLIFAFQALGTAEYVVGPRESRTLTAPYWRTVVWSDRDLDRSPQIRFLRHLPAESVILTNVWELVTFSTGLPTKVWPAQAPPPSESLPHHLAGTYLLWDPSYRTELPDPVALLGDQASRSLRLLGTWDGVMLYRVEADGGQFTPSVLPAKTARGGAPQAVLLESRSPSGREQMEEVR